MRLTDIRSVGDKVGTLGHRAFPAIAKSDNAVIVCWRQARSHAVTEDDEPNGVIYTARSTDGGASFSAGSEAINDLAADSPHDLRDPSIDWLPSINRWAIWYFKYQLHSTPTPIVTGRDRVKGTHIRFSDDDGLTWGDEIDIAPIGNAKGRGHILTRTNRDRDLVVPIYGYLSGQTWFSARLFASKDGGETWAVVPGPPMREDVALTPTENEVIVLSDGRWLGQWRTGTTVVQRALSTDEGLTWSAPWTLTGVIGTPSGLVETEDGRIVTGVRQQPNLGLAIVTTATAEATAATVDPTFRAGDFSTGYLTASRVDSRTWLAAFYRDRAETIADSFVARLVDAA